MIICEKFSPQSLVAWYIFCGTSEKSAKVFLWKNLIFHQFVKVFSPKSFHLLHGIISQLFCMCYKISKTKISLVLGCSLKTRLLCLFRRLQELIHELRNIYQIHPPWSTHLPVQSTNRPCRDWLGPGASIPHGTHHPEWRRRE